MAEIASDIAEVHTELASLGRSVREDVGLVHRLTGEVRAGLGRARLVPIGSLYTRFVRQGQEAARAASKSVRIETSGESVELDASVIEQIVDPLLHLAQNAVGARHRESRGAPGGRQAGGRRRVAEAPAIAGPSWWWRWPTTGGASMPTDCASARSRRAS